MRPLLLLPLLLIVSLASCAWLSSLATDLTGRTPGELAAASLERAQINMTADGIDVAEATPGEWRTYLADATKSLVLEEIEAAKGEPDLLEQILGVAWPQAGKVYGLLVLAIATLTQRGRRNVATVLSPKQGTKTSAAALAALTLGLDSPTPPPVRPGGASSTVLSA